MNNSTKFTNKLLKTYKIKSFDTSLEYKFNFYCKFIHATLIQVPSIDSHKIFLQLIYFDIFLYATTFSAIAFIRIPITKLHKLQIRSTASSSVFSREIRILRNY